MNRSLTFVVVAGLVATCVGDDLPIVPDYRKFSPGAVTVPARIGNQAAPRTPDAVPPAKKSVLLKMQIISIDVAKARDAKLDVPELLSLPNGDGNVSTPQLLSLRERKLLLQVLERSGVCEVIASPTIVVADGRPGSFLSGGEIPIPTPDGDTTAIEFREFGHKIECVAHIAGDGLRLDLHPSFTEVVQNGDIGVPSFIVREMRTALAMQAGQTVVLSDLRSAGRRHNNHLLYVVTPEIVERRIPPGVAGETATTHADELRQIRDEIKLLRQDVSRLIDVLQR